MSPGTPVATAGAPLPSGYRPWLDGLRGVAVLLVVVQHGLRDIPIELGSVGVGIFFGLSGYLITSLLLDELARNGSLSLSRFYLRRAARLVPALVLVVLVCDTLFLVQGDRAPLKGSLVALAYVSNYVQVLSPGFVHAYGPTWSLAVEEHFYIVWPIVLGALTARFRLRTVLVFTLAFCVVALGWRCTLAALDVGNDLIAIGSLERADAILYGSGAAIALRIGWRPRPWVFWTGVAVIGAMTVILYQGGDGPAVLGVALLAMGSAAVVTGLDLASPGWARRGLSSPPLVRIGVLSYGIYLWHGPLMRMAATAGHGTNYGRGVAAVASIAAAALSYRLVESPIRSWARRASDRHPVAVT